ncbi:MAG: transposase [Alphaproteobacteria bacterium]|nr:transposase [Alphaproteobacteria bacterium]
MGYKDLKEVCADLKKIYTASSAEIGFQNLNDFSEKWDDKYAYILRSWRDILIS